LARGGFFVDDTQRVFIAIELSDPVKKWLAAARTALEPAVPAGTVRWVDGQGIHLTLKFLGDIPARQIDEVRGAMDRAAADGKPFPVTVEGLGCFPNLNRPRVVWAGVRAQAELGDLQSRLEIELEGVGFAREERAFSPHLTLGRVRDGIPDSRRAAIGAAVAAEKTGASVSMKAGGFSLFRSVLRPGGAEYTVIYSAQFNKS
jgi:2'-5' RNA ligase